MPADVHFDFSAALLLASVVTGAGYLLDVLWLSKQRTSDEPGRWVEFCRSFFPVIFLVLVLRSFLVEPFRIPSGSMIPTLHVGDFILVNKFSYGFRMPVFHNVLIPVSDPERGDVMVFRYPVDPSKDFIKRVIGLPGDRIAYQGKTLTINGEVMSQEVSGYYSADAAGRKLIAEEKVENLGELEHKILINPNRPDDDGEFVVPEGHYFMMGDNRDGSDDSRGWGFVPERNLVGKAFFIWMSWDSQKSRPAFDRIGQSIR
ncbi:MAG: signal peptidase I [Oceanococcus sp.]